MYFVSSLFLISLFTGFILFFLGPVRGTITNPFPLLFGSWTRSDLKTKTIFLEKDESSSRCKLKVSTVKSEENKRGKIEDEQHRKGPMT